MSRGWRWKSGDWNALCDSCSQKKKASELKLRWDGFYVCSHCWEPRHSQDFLRARADKQYVPWTRPVPTDVFVPVNYPWYVDYYYFDDDYVEGTII